MSASWGFAGSDAFAPLFSPFEPVASSPSSLGVIDKLARLFPASMGRRRQSSFAVKNIVGIPFAFIGSSNSNPLTFGSITSMSAISNNSPQSRRISASEPSNTEITVCPESFRFIQVILLIAISSSTNRIRLIVHHPFVISIHAITDNHKYQRCSRYVLTITNLRFSIGQMDQLLSRQLH